MALEPRDFPDIPHRWKQIERQGKARDAHAGKKKSIPNTHRSQKRDPMEGTTTKFEALTLHADTDPDISQKRGKGDNGGDLGKKRKKAPVPKPEPPPPPKPRFEEVLPGLSSSELSSYIAQQSKRFEDQIVWLRDVVSFLQSHLDADPKQYGPLMDPQDNLFPFSALSNETKQILLAALEPQPDRILETLFVDCIREVLIPHLNANKPTYGVRVMLKAICIHKYYPVVAHCRKLPELVRSYASNSKLCLSILWSIYDIKSLEPAFATWKDAMYPILLGHAAKDVTRCAWNSLSNLLAYHKSIGTEVTCQFLKSSEHTKILTAFAKHHDNNASDEIKQEFHRVCSLLQKFTYQYDPHNTLRGHFPNLLEQLNSDVKGSSRFLQQQLLSCLLVCVESDPHCTKLWCRDILGRLPASLMLLKYMFDRKEKCIDAINRINIKREGMKQCSSSVTLFSGLKEELKNEENDLYAKFHKSEGYNLVLDLIVKFEKESASRRVLVNNLKKTANKSSWLKNIFWFSFLFFISALFVDIVIHDTLRVTFFGRFLDDIGILPWAMLAKNTLVEKFPEVIEFSESAWVWTKHHFELGMEYSKQFFDNIFPRYMKTLLEYLVYVSEEILEFCYPAWLYLLAKFDTFAGWFYSNIFLSHFVQITLNGLLIQLNDYFQTPPI